MSTIQPILKNNKSLFCPLLSIFETYKKLLIKFILERSLCGQNNTISCKGYQECIYFSSLLDGIKDCFDGSDEGDVLIRINY